MIKCACSLGMDVVVTDHHLPDATLPPAVAVVNPNRLDCNYPNKHLCGAGVTFKLIESLLRRSSLPACRQEQLLSSLLKPVSIATMADVVPLVGENRTLVARGLSSLRTIRNPGLAALFSVAGVGSRDVPSSQQIAFQIAPRINAAGRMESARAVTDLLLIAGRDFTWSELYNRTPVAIVSENLGRELWGNARAAVGKRIRVAPRDDWREVIGVVADLHDDGIDQKPPTIVYWPLLLKNFQGGDTVIRGASYIIRTPRAGSTALLHDLQKAVASVNAILPISDVKTLQSIYESSLARSSVTLVLLAISGGMALLLGMVGLYGVISYSVSQRTREIGIRLALGAPLRELTRLFVREGLLMSGVGAICGLTAALTLTRLMRSLLFEVSPADPLTYAAASAGLMVAALLGSYLPARRAIKVDPVEALRAE